MKKTYSSKVSYGLILIVFAVFYGPIFFGLDDQGITSNVLWILIFVSIVYLFLLYLLFTTRYIIDDNLLRIKCGIFSYKPIEIESIKEISKSSNIISSPAASFDRIEIKYGRFDEIILSPKDKLSFANDLVSINHKINNKLAGNK